MSARASILKSLIKNCQSAMATDNDEEFDSLLKDAKKEAKKDGTKGKAEKPAARTATKEEIKEKLKELPKDGATKLEFLDFLKTKIHKSPRGHASVMSSVSKKQYQPQKEKKEKGPIQPKAQEAVKFKPAVKQHQSKKVRDGLQDHR